MIPVPFLCGFTDPGSGIGKSETVQDNISLFCD